MCHIRLSRRIKSPPDKGDLGGWVCIGKCLSNSKIYRSNLVSILPRYPKRERFLIRSDITIIPVCHRNT